MHRMQKNYEALIGPCALIVGTCIGGGVLALPMKLAAVGIVASFFLMFAAVSLHYASAMMCLELCAYAGQGISISELAKRYAGEFIGFITRSAFTLLGFSLLAVYLSGGASIFSNLLKSLGITLEHSSALSLYTLATSLLFIGALSLVDRVNRVLLLALLASFFILIASLLACSELKHIPLLPVASHFRESIPLCVGVLPVLFSSFAFENVSHTLFNLSHERFSMLRKAVYIALGLTATIYLMWTLSAVGALVSHNPLFFQEMIQKGGNVPVGNVVAALGNAVRWPLFYTLVWIVSWLALITSFIGVGLGVIGSMNEQLAPLITSTLKRRVVSTVSAIAPPYVAVLLYPGAFLPILEVAGILFITLFIFLPAYLLEILPVTHYRFLPQKSAHWIARASVGAGGALIVWEIVHKF